MGDNGSRMIVLGLRCIFFLWGGIYFVRRGFAKADATATETAEIAKAKQRSLLYKISGGALLLGFAMSAAEFIYILSD